MAALIAALKLPDYGEGRGVNLAKPCRQTDLNPEEVELFLIELNRAEMLSFTRGEARHVFRDQAAGAWLTPRLALDRPARVEPGGERPRQARPDD